MNNNNNNNKIIIIIIIIIINIAVGDNSTHNHAYALQSLSNLDFSFMPELIAKLIIGIIIAVILFFFLLS